MPQMMKPSAMTKVQIPITRPNVLILPSSFVDENNTKYPTIVQKVAGKNEKKKHIINPLLRPILVLLIVMAKLLSVKWFYL